MRDGLAGIETRIFTVMMRLHRSREEVVSSYSPSSVGEDGRREIEEELRKLGFRTPEVKRNKRALLAYAAGGPLPEAIPNREAER
jgi:hypothetical protein